jgi:hypothetical protein
MKSSADRNEEQKKDMRLKEKVEHLLSEARYSEPAWEQLDVSGKKALLQKMVSALNRILDLDVHREILYDIGGALGEGPLEVASYDSKTGRISINAPFLYSRKNSYLLLRGLVHERRHAYQHEAVRCPDRYRISEETRVRWAEDFSNPLPRGTDDYRKIASRSVEYDAYCFSGQLDYLNGVTPCYTGSWDGIFPSL